MASDFQVGKQVGHAASDFTKQAYVVKYLIYIGRSKMTKKHLTSYVNAPFDKISYEIGIYCLENAPETK